MGGARPAQHGIQAMAHLVQDPGDDGSVCGGVEADDRVGSLCPVDVVVVGIVVEGVEAQVLVVVEHAVYVNGQTLVGEAPFGGVVLHLGEVFALVGGSEGLWCDHPVLDADPQHSRIEVDGVIRVRWNGLDLVGVSEHFSNLLEGN